MSKKLSMTARLCVAGLFFSLAIGCGSKQTNFTVSGTVTFNGQPVPGGEVFLRPSKGNTGSGGFAIIKNGKYKTAPNRGSEGGSYQLTFHGLGGKAVDEFGGASDLFVPYAVEVDLPKSDFVFDVEVPKK